MNQILEDSEVQKKTSEYLQSLNAYWIANPGTKNISDVRACHKKDNKILTDESGNELQFVDLVMEGGGVLGFALVGYTYFLEKVGIRFVGLGGTSAGSINALLLASLGKFIDKKSEKVLDTIDQKSFFDFVDGGIIIKTIIDFIVKFKNLKQTKKIIIALILSSILLFFLTIIILYTWNIAGSTAILTILLTGICIFVTIKIKNFFGLNPGDDFEEWLKKVLTENPGNAIKTIADIEKNFYDDKIELYNIEKKEMYEYCINKKLAIITAETISETKVRFPFMSRLFFKDWKNEHPSKYVRMSMSIPFFFKPVILDSIPNASIDTNLQKDWFYWAGFGRTNEGDGKKCTEYPQKALFEDGGTLSNFPIDCFHTGNKFVSDYDCDGNRLPVPSNNSIPNMPTFGVKLGMDRNNPKKISNFSNLVFQIFNTSRHLHDYEFLISNPEYRQLVSYIDTDSTEVNWLDFNVSSEGKRKLFIQGMKTAHDFLKTFDWKKYKETRKVLESISPIPQNKIPFIPLSSN